MTTFNIYMNSGGINTSTFTNNDNVSLLEITNSDQDYYQTGILSLFDVTYSYNIGCPVLVQIDNTDQFSGYIARKQQEIKYGKKIITYQLIGKTYDLWRYRTTQPYLVTGTTSYIASSLISTFATGISGQYVYVNSGTNISEEIDLSNKLVGDAILELTALDGFKFFVDNNNQLHYYEPTIRHYDFTIEESDIIDMSPIEESDEDLINDVLVIGGSDYSSKTQVSTNHPSAATIPSGILVAQQFIAEDDKLSSIKLYLDRSRDPNQPGTLEFEIWNSTSKQILDDEFENDNNIAEHNGTITGDYEGGDDSSTLRLNPKTDTTYATYSGTPNTTPLCKRAGQVFRVTSPCSIYNIKFDDTFACYEFSDDGNVASNHRLKIYKGNPNTGTLYATSMPIWGNYGDDFEDFYFTGNQIKPYTTGVDYSFVISNDIDQDNKYYYSMVNPGGYANGNAWKYVGSTWTEQSGIDARNFYVYGYVYPASGEAYSTISYYECKYLKADIVYYRSSQDITVSGTNDNGSTWMAIKNDSWDSSNKWITFDSASSDGIQIRYYLDPENAYYTPEIESITLTIGDAAASSSGYPDSSNKIEWSDDLSWYSTDIPYPPSYSSWKSYSDPKLQLIEGNSYWLVFSYMSGSSEYWNYYYDPKSTYSGKIMYGRGTNSDIWSGNAEGSITTLDDNYEYDVPAGDMTFSLGWIDGELTATATNTQSINRYGRHSKIINDSNLNTQVAVQARADAEVNGMESITKKGTLTIDGITDIQTYYRFSSNLTNFDIVDIWDVVSYTQRIDNKGFTTTINYGRQPFDITRRISELEKEVY